MNSLSGAVVSGSEQVARLMPLSEVAAHPDAAYVILLAMKHGSAVFDVYARHQDQIQTAHKLGGQPASRLLMDRLCVEALLP